MSRAEQTLRRIPRIVWLTAGGATLGVSVIGIIFLPPPAATLALPAIAAPALAAQAALPSFDIVRVSPDGAAVIAGRAADYAEVSVREGDREIGRTQADEHGHWVITPDLKLIPGSPELTIIARSPTGETARSAAPVQLLTPARGVASSGQTAQASR